MRWEEGRSLKEFSTFGIGGPIRLFTEAKSEEAMREALIYCKEQKIPYFILGKGSNCLFDDSGFDGAVILNRIDFCTWHEKEVDVGAGFSFSLLGVQSARRGLKGLEFAAGIPATVGGAVWMNAGANGCETESFLKQVTFIDEDGVRKELLKSELEFAYRFSSFQKMKGAIVAAKFELVEDKQARQRQIEIIEKRIQTQPLKEKNGGCVFRNPTGCKGAGALIDGCGLKGEQVGGAVVSEIHANFIVNRTDAKSEDVQALISIIQKKVYEETGIHLEPEIRVIKNRT